MPCRTGTFAYQHPDTHAFREKSRLVDTFELQDLNALVCKWRTRSRHAVPTALWEETGA